MARQLDVPIGPSIAYVPLSKGLFALIDSEDAGRIGQYNWSAVWKEQTSDYRAVRTVFTEAGGKRNVYLHREVLNLWGSKPTVDHKRPDSGLDNRKANLRTATQSQQEANKGLQSNNTSGERGVVLCSGRWRASIKVDGTRRHLGYFSTKQEAASAYRAAASEHFGEFCRID